MKYFSTFSGIGGFELGIKQAYEDKTCDKQQVPEQKSLQDRRDNMHSTCEGEGKHWNEHANDNAPTCIGYSEIDKYAIQVYEKHFNQEKIYETDKGWSTLQGTEWSSIQPKGDKSDFKSWSNSQSETWWDRKLQQPKNIITTHKNYGDITKINVSELPDFDLLVGGFPCQSFSIAGKRRGFDDTRGTLFFDLARICAEKRPRLVVFENVKGLLSHDQGKTFQTILGVLSDLGYGVQWQVLNSKNFGVPQNRERVFIIGHLRGTSRPEVFPIGEVNGATVKKLGNKNPSGHGQSGQVVSPEGLHPTIGAGGGNPNRKRDIGWSSGYIQQLNQPKHSNDRVYSEEGISPTLNTMQGGNRQPFIKTNKKTYGKLDDRTLESKERLQEQEGNLLSVQRGEENGDTSHRQGLAQQQARESTGNMSELPQQDSSTKEDVQDLREATKRSSAVQQTLHSMEKGEVKIRRLSPVECERLQGFPDGWTEGLSDTQRYKCLGNAVTVNVIKAIMGKLL